MKQNKMLNFTISEFLQDLQNHKNSILFEARSADLETPVSAYLKLRRVFPRSLLYESVEKAAGRGRYSIIACHPDIIWTCEHGKASETYYDDIGNEVKKVIFDDPVSSLKNLHHHCKVTIPKPLPSAASGLFGYFSYDMVRFFEKLPDAPPDMIGIPDAVMWRPRIILMFDSVYDILYVISTVYGHIIGQPEEAYEKAKTLIEQVFMELAKPVGAEMLSSTQAEGSTVTPIPHITKQAYEGMVSKAREYIYAGDAFQIVPSQRFHIDFPQDSLHFYRTLRRVNPSPYMFHAAFDGFSLVGASPEILVKVQDRIVTIRPIAGTRPRGKTLADDKRLEQELLSDPKELSEHLMLLDLGRNDVGRVSQIGTVNVTEEFVVERYSHVMHIVSNVCGVLKPEYDFLDAIFSALPAGTVSGAPKIRAMEIINELETEKRSFYAGGIGYFSGDGNGDFALMLRTGLIKDEKLYIQAGAGVVYDSVPENEYTETINKVGALLMAASLCL